LESGIQPSIPDTLACTHTIQLLVGNPAKSWQAGKLGSASEVTLAEGLGADVVRLRNKVASLLILGRTKGFVFLHYPFERKFVDLVHPETKGSILLIG